MKHCFMTKNSFTVEVTIHNIEIFNYKQKMIVKFDYIL